MSKGEERRYEFKFSRMQIVLLFAGIGIMAAVMFALGTVVGKSLGEINTIISKPAKAVAPPAEVAPQAAPSPQPPQPAAPPAPQEAIPASPPPLTKAASPEPIQPAVPAPEQAKALHEPPAAAPPQAEDKTAPAKVEKAAQEKPQAKPEAEKPIKQPRKTVQKPVAKPAASKAMKPVAGADTSPKAYLLQAGSFAGQADADQLAKKLRRKGFRATIYPIEVEGKGTWYRVRTGPYQSRQAADKNLIKLQQINGLTPLLIAAD